MARANRLSSYKKVKITTADPGQRVVMLYDGILKDLRLAQEAFQENEPDRFETIHNHLTHAQDIIFELQMALDKERGGDIAKSLDDQYSFWLNQIHEANFRKDPEYLPGIYDIVSDLREVWNQAAIEARKQDNAE